MSDPRDLSRWSAGDLISTGFIHIPEYARLVEETCPVRDIDVEAFDAVVAGHQAPCSRSKKPKILHVKFVAFSEAGKVAAALCHCVSILRYAMLKSGRPLVRGKIFTGFSNMEKRRRGRND
jgi:hypothetical protein